MKQIAQKQLEPISVAQIKEILKKEAQIFTFGDLLKLYPYRYIDRTQFYSTQHIDNTQTYIQLKGKIRDIREIGNGRGKRLTAVFYDNDGSIELVWFQGIKPMCCTESPTGSTAS